MTSDTRAFLGVGWKFPLQVTASGAIASARHELRIEESILLILGTKKRERVMRPDFGCGIHDLAFAPNNAGTRALVVDDVRRALVAHEPRIDVLDVRAESTADEPNVLLVRIDYRVRSTNALHNFVYPFYIQEGA